MPRSLRPLALAAALLAGSLAATACAPVTSYNGFQAREEKPQDVKVGVDTKSTLLSSLGSPSMKSTFDPNVWFYVSQITDEYAYYKPRVRTRDVVRITFGADEKVTEVKHLTLGDGYLVAYDRRETPTRGRSLSWIEQVLGTIGRGGALPQENDPGNPRGGGR
jgi:outer membrane protein assembly factor BamE (lipoprotein component of BamABCDE complex)